MAKRRGGAVATVTTKDAEGNITSQRTYSSADASPEVVAVLSSGDFDHRGPTLVERMQEPGPGGIPMGAYALAGAGLLWWGLS